MYEVSIFQITRFLNPRIFHLRFVKFPNSLSLHQPYYSTLQLKLFLVHVSNERIVEDDRPSELALRKQEETRDRLEGGNCTRCIGARVFCTPCDRRRLSTRREQLSDDVSTLPLSRSLAFLSRLVLCFFLSPLIRRCISGFLFFYFPFFRSGSSVFTFHGKVGLYFFEDEVFWRIIKVY